MPALRLDAALVHMNRADAAGNGQYLGPDPYFDDLFCLAAERAYVSCERIVASLDGPPQTLLLNRAMVHGVAETPNGAHFTSCAPDYGRDEAFQARYAAAAGDPRPGRSSGPSTWTATRPPTSGRCGDRPRGGGARPPASTRPGPRCAWWRAPRRGAATARSWPARWGSIPSLGARLARLTFAPGLLLTDGEAYLVDAGRGSRAGCRTRRCSPCWPRADGT